MSAASAVCYIFHYCFQLSVVHQFLCYTQISDIEELMQESKHVLLKYAPSAGDLVTVSGPIKSSYCTDKGSIFYRAQVLV